MTEIEIVNEHGMIRVIAWDKQRKKTICDWVKKSELRRLVMTGYILAIHPNFVNEGEKGGENVIKITNHRR